jgi:hypothetical protein
MLPDGSIILESDPAGRWVKYQTRDGQIRIRFRADEAFTFEPPRVHDPTFEAEAGITADGTVEVLEGRNRAVGAVHGDVIPPELGGVPDDPGWLDYNFRPIKDPAPLIPMKGMPRAQ